MKLRYLMWGLFILLLAVNVNATCCGNSCYLGGVCINNVWSEGCLDNNDQVYAPENLMIGSDCTVCKCSSATGCKWQPNHALCADDEICSFPSQTLQGLSQSDCVDRDSSATSCNYNAVCPVGIRTWAQFGDFVVLLGGGVDGYETLGLDGCCGDDPTEYLVTCKDTNAQGSCGNVEACCTTSTDCVFQLEEYNWCISSGESYGASIAGNSFCSSGSWYDSDQNAQYCVQGKTYDLTPPSLVDKGISWNIGGNIAATNCCGDDLGEYSLECSSNNAQGTCGNDKTACCSSSLACVDQGGSCQDSDKCYGTPIFGNSYCKEGKWYNPDASAEYCALTCDLTTDDQGIGFDIGGEIQDCCGDDPNEYYITKGVGDKACCSSPTACVDINGVCRSGVETWNTGDSCSNSDSFGPIDDDCDGVANDLDLSCCESIDQYRVCCDNQYPPAQNPSAWQTGVGCCETNDYGSVVQNSLCYQPNAWIDRTNTGVVGNIYLIGNTTSGGYDMLAGSWYMCDAKGDGPATDGVTVKTITNFNSASITKDSKTHEYLCYLKKDNTVEYEQFAECSGSEPLFSLNSLAGDHITDGNKITNASGAVSYCCNDAGWHINLDDETCRAVNDQNNACVKATFKIAQSGETGQFGEYIAYRSDGCCGDDAGEFYQDSYSKMYVDAGTSFCCNSNQKCVWNAKCNDKNPESTGDLCYDGIDNDCDDSYDFGQTTSSLPQLESLSEEFRPGVNEDQSDSDCIITLTGVVLDGSKRVEDAEITISGTFKKPYNGKRPSFVYRVYTSSATGTEQLDAPLESSPPVNAGTFSIKVNGDSSYDITVSKEGFETLTKHVDVDFSSLDYNDYPDNMKFQLGIEHETCASDCTNVGNNRCNKDCDNETGATAHPSCHFYSDDVKNLCNEKEVGHMLSLGNNQVVNCCEGEPYEYVPKKVSVNSQKDLIRTTRIITYRGKPIKMVVDAFG